MSDESTAPEPTPGTRPVVVGVDGSDGALDAVNWAAVEAHRRAAPLRVVTAFAWAPERGHPGLREHYRADLLQRAREHLRTGAVTVAERAVSGLRVCAEVVVGPPIATLYEESRRAQLLVLGNRGLGGLGGLLVGSVAVGLSAHAACPVVVVRGEDRDPLSPRPVVLGVDGSPTSEAATAFAFDAAAARDAPLVAVRTVPDSTIDARIAPLIDWDAVLDTQRTLLTEHLGGWADKHPDVALTPVVVRGGAATALVERSRAAQLVVVGSRGRGGFAGLVLGSVSHGVLHHSHCPVAIVRPDTAGAGGPA
ncbi:universal stress protein [Pseudonocardia humida]|uniref:Universal stress protein n=1 Tax=Pseudonocardia humida TaxID=2800819 RepID=A0ABT1AA77_9PSEU|nr:universal stress protein [Pseudonocardia humida]MCO1659937.1 universal stress protein [Pseudonocardia humida]